MAAASSGCSSTQVTKSDGAARWSGLGVQMALPEGTWRIRQSEKEQAATFVQEGRRGNVVLFRLKTTPNAPGWLAFKRLFADFVDKKEVAQGYVALPESQTAEWSEYEVKTKDHTTRVKAYALRRGGWTYELAEWGFEEKPPGEKMIAGLEFAE